MQDQSAFETAAIETAKLKTARGSRYYDILKNICRLIEADFKQDYSAIRSHYGKVTPVMAGVLTLRYGLNYKATFFALETICNAPSGWYDRLIVDGGQKVGDILEAARNLEDCPVPCVSRYVN